MACADKKYEVWVGDLNSLYDFEIDGKPPYAPVLYGESDDLDNARKLREYVQDYQTAAWIQTETGEVVF